MRSGVLAGRAIARNQSFNKAVYHLNQEMKRSVRLREIINTMDNKDYDRLIAAGTLPLVKNLIYNTNFPILKYTADILELVRASGDWQKKSILPDRNATKR